MNKKLIRITAIVVVLSIAGLIAFNWKDINKSISDRKKANKLRSLTVEVAAKNSSDIVRVYYPYYTYKLVYGNALTGDHGGILQKSLGNDIKNKEIPKASLKKLLKLMDSIEQDPSSENNQTYFDKNNYTYRISLHYRDSKGKSKSLDIRGYDALPQCWPEFSAFVNDIIEFEALDPNPELLHFSEEWYKEAFAINDSVFVNGSFSDMVRRENLCMANIIGDRSWGPMASINRYLERFTALDWKDLKELAAHEIKTADSTEEEFVNFVDNYTNTVFGENCNIFYYQLDDGTKYGASCSSPISLTIYRSCEWQPERDPDGTYAEIEILDMDGLTSITPAYYSPDNKYVLVTNSNQEKYFKAFGLLDE